MSHYGFKASLVRTINRFSQRRVKNSWADTNLLGSTRETAQRSLESALYCIATGKSLDEVAENSLTAFRASLDCVAFLEGSHGTEDLAVKGNRNFVYDMGDYNSTIIWAIESWIRGTDLSFIEEPKNPPKKYSPPRWLRDNKLHHPKVRVGKRPAALYAKLGGIEYTPTEHRGALRRLISEVLHPEATPKQVTEMAKAARKGYAKASKAYFKALAARDARLNKA